MNFENNTVKFLILERSKQFFTKYLKGNWKPLLFRSLAKESTISVFYVKELPDKQVFSESTTICVDIRVKDFSVMSTREKVENPKR